LAQSFEEKSKQQVSDTETRLTTAFEMHATFISDALGKNETIISDVISAQNRRVRALLLKTWIWMALSLIAILIASYGVIWLQGEMITKNWQAISEQKDTLQQLEAKGGKIQWNRCGDNRRLCVMIDEKAETYGQRGEWRILKGY
ncbi:MAG: MbeB family mobilization protein, partial [Plesiomonas sp.]